MAAKKAVAKKAATKKVAKKVVKKVATKKVVVHPTPNLNALRRTLAHAACIAGGLVVGDRFDVFDYSYCANVPGEPDHDWRAAECENVRFLGVDEEGLLVVQLAEGDDQYHIPVIAVDWDTHDTSDDAEINVLLNGNYTANASQQDVIEDGIVHVGCQAIEISAVRELLTKIDEIEKRGVKVRPETDQKTRTAQGTYPSLDYVEK